jgi:hypothetical protein
MADAATISVTATMLPDEIAKTISGSMTVTPSDANHKWYYKFTSVSNSSTDLMAGYFTDYLAIDDDTVPIAITTSDTVAFLFIQNTDASNHVYVNIAAGTAAATTPSLQPPPKTCPAPQPMPQFSSSLMSPTLSTTCW